TAGEVSLVKRNTQIGKALDIGTHQPDRKCVTAFVHRPVVTIFCRRPVVIDVAAKKTAREFKRSGEAVSARCIVGIVYGAVRIRRQQLSSLVVRRGSSNKRALILRLDRSEIFLCGRVDSSGL